MIKRILTLLLSVLLIMGICVPVLGEEVADVAVSAVADEAADAVVDEEPVAESEEKAVRHTVVDTEDLNVAQTAGLAVSAAYAREADLSLRWNGEDFKRAIPLPVTRSDWSDSAFLEFWAYSVVQTESAFGLILISDNPETKEVDYYQASVNANFKGWYLVSLPFVNFEAVNSPKGFESIDKIELWPNRGSYSMHSAASLYLDSFEISNKQSETEAIVDEYLMFDFRTRDSFARTGLKEDKNKTLVKAPDKETMAVKYTDVIRYGTSPDGCGMAPPDPDCTGYSHVEIVVYNEQPTKDSWRVVFRSDNEAVAGNEYYYYDVALDWIGWKAIQLPLDGFSSATGRELGWNQINEFNMWWYLGGDTAEEQEKVDTTTYLETISLKNVDPNERFKAPIYMEDMPTLPDQVDVASIIKENFPNNEHPRLLITQDRIDWIKENWQTDTFLSKVVPNFLSVCDTYIGQKIATTGTYSPTAAIRAEALALAWKLTGDQKYADECWERVKELTYEASYWADSSFALTIGDCSRSIAVAYDLMYHDWTEEQRRTLRNAMILYAVNTSKGNVTRMNGVQRDDSNWTPIGNSGLGMIALVLADEPGYENITNGYINRLHDSNEYFFKNFGPDGSGHEGPDYWNYMMGNYVKYEAALYRSLGSEKSEIFNKFSMTDQWGLENTGEFITHMMGTRGTSFNFSDGAARGVSVPGNMWLAEFYGRPEQGGAALESGSATAADIYFYNPDIDYSIWRDVLPLDSAWTEGSPQAGSMRTSWEKGNTGFYVGYKGNNANKASHSRMDTGTFVLENQGQRFIVQIDDANYDLPGMFNTQRYQYYRNRAEGSNTLVIGPGVHQGSNVESSQGNSENVVDQVFMNKSLIVETASKDFGSYSIIDMSDAYKATADVAKRGFALIDGRNAFLLQDEITVKKATDVYSFMHTEADIEIAPDGQSAILTQGGKKMKVALLANCNAKLVDLPAEPFSTTPQVDHEDNSKWRKLTVKASVSSNATFSLLFTPYYGEGQYTYSMDKIIPLKDWGSKLLVEPIALTGIYLDGVLLPDFEPGKLVYLLKEDSLGTITATADGNVNIEIQEAKKLGLPTIITATKGSNKTVYVVNYSNEQQELLDSFTSYPVIDYDASIGKENIPNLWDGVDGASWYNEGSQWVIYDLGAPKKIFEVEMLWGFQGERVEDFCIEVSNDKKTWTKVWEGKSILSTSMEKYKFDEVTAQYIKVTGIKNSKNNWTTIYELWITASGESFEDVPSTHWAAQAINDMAKVALVQGVEPGIYSPEAPLSRAAFLTMLSRVYNLAKSDYTGNVPGIAADAWYTPYLETAYKLGLVPEAMLEGGFQPNKNITREEISALAVTFYEYFVRPINGTSLDKFSDNGAISDWARPYVEKCLAMRVIAGMTDTTFEPAANATRAQAATILKRVYIKAN